MANVKITELTALTDPASTDVLPIVDVVADITKKISIADLLENAGSGTAAAPGIAFDGDSNTGIYRPGADQLAISTGGAQALYINADGDILVADGNRMEIDEVRARDGAGLKLFDDAGAGIFVEDGGNVGVGTSSPQALGHFSNTAGSAEVRITCGGSAVSGESILRFGNVNDQTMASIRFDSTNDNLSFYSTNDTRAMTIDSSQRVGIGTTGPLFKLVSQVSSTSSTISAVTTHCSVAIQNNGASTANQLASLVFRLQDGSYNGNSTIACLRESATAATQSLVFAPSNGSGDPVEKARIDSSGRLLVGTSTARSNFFNLGVYTAKHIVEGTGGTGAGRGSIAIVNNSTIATDPGYLVFGRTKGSVTGSNTVLAADDWVGMISFQGSDGAEFVECAQINAYVDGTPGANDMPGRLVFSTRKDGQSSPTPHMQIGNNGTFRTFCSNSTSSGHLQAHAGSAGSTYPLFEGKHSAASITGGTTSFKVTTNGNVTNTNNSYGAISDIKLKENIVDASSQWDDLKALRFVNYNFKPETGAETFKQLGLIAQEVETVCPKLVGETPDRDEEGNDLGTVTKSVNYSVLYMKAVKALQEAMERIEVLEAKVNALEGN